jgi:rod shape-determining protein MreC
MKALLYFLIRNAHWLLAILLVVFSFYLVFSFNSFQRSVFLSSANVVTGNVYTVANNVEAFFQLRRNNAQLLQQNMQLKKELYTMRVYMGNRLNLDSTEVQAFVRDSLDNELQRFDFIPARVVNKTTAGPNNYITINRGAAHGIRQNMGVVSHDGIVGIVSNVSQQFSVVLPVINPRFGLRARLQTSQHVGSISWNGENAHEAQLIELPRHEVFRRGDAVVTAFAGIFPQNAIIGFVSEPGESRDGNFNEFTIQLATNFHTLQSVLVIDDKFFEVDRQMVEIVLKIFLNQSKHTN